MGQKVHPLGFRRGFLGHPKKDIEKALTFSSIYGRKGTVQENTETIHGPGTRKIPGPLRTSFEYGPRPAKGSNSYSQKLHDDFIIESLVQEIFHKSGYLVASISIWRTTKELEIYIEVFTPLTPLQKETSGGPRIRNSQQKVHSLPKVEKGYSKTNLETGGFDLELETLTAYFASGKFGANPLSQPLTVQWYITPLNKFLPQAAKLMGEARAFPKVPRRDSVRLSLWQSHKNQPTSLPLSAVKGPNTTEDFQKNKDLATYITRSLTTALRSFNKEFFFKNGIAILTLTHLRPNASLLAKFMGAVLQDLPKGQPFIDFIGQGLSTAIPFHTAKSAAQVPLVGVADDGNRGLTNSWTRPAPNEHLPLKGSLIKVKGRINGSDRSRTSSYRYGSIPLHTIDAFIDYGFATTQTSYGASSIKVWLKA